MCENKPTKEAVIISQIFGSLNQENMSIETYYRKINRHCQELGLSDNYARIVFLKGLNSENWKKATMIGIELPLNVLIDNLTRFQNMSSTTRCPNCLQSLK